MTLASNPIGHENVASATDLYIPTDAFRFRTTKRYGVDVPSVAIFALSNPATTGTTATQRSIPDEDEWVFLKYIDVFLEFAWVDMMGRVEAGAESPYEDLFTFIKELLEPDPYEETAGSFDPVTWVVYGMTTFDISVPGEMPGGQALTSG